MSLADKWKTDKRKRQVTFPTSIRLTPAVDQLLQMVLDDNPKLSQTQVINDCLFESLSQVYSAS